MKAVADYYNLSLADSAGVFCRGKPANSSIQRTNSKNLHKVYILVQKENTRFVMQKSWL